MSDGAIITSHVDTGADVYGDVRTGAVIYSEVQQQATIESHMQVGAPGRGVPTGGMSGQFLRKHSDADYDSEWASPFNVGTSPPSNPAVGDLWVDTN